MTDKPTPTDAELKAMWQLHAADIGGIFYYARAVLAKWGQPAQAAEPVARLEIESLKAQLHAAKQINAAQFGLLAASIPGSALRASHGQAPASVLHLVNSAFAEIAMVFPKAFALHKVGIADTAVLEALAAPATAQAADSVQEDAARYRWLRDQAHPDSEDSGIAVSESDFNDWGNKFTRYYSGEELDAAIDAAMNKGATQ